MYYLLRPKPHKQTSSRRLLTAGLPCYRPPFRSPRKPLPLAAALSSVITSEPRLSPGTLGVSRLPPSDPASRVACASLRRRELVKQKLPPHRVATHKKLTTTPMTTDNPTITFKVQNLYVAYAPGADLCCYGGCFEEAAHGLRSEEHTSE